MEHTSDAAACGSESPSPPPTPQQLQAGAIAAATTTDVAALDVMQSALKLAPFTPSGDGVLAFATELLQLDAQDVLFDLGCGDARTLVYAAQASGARCVGVEYNAELVVKAKARVLAHGVEERVTIVHGDALQADLSDATALFLYLVPQGLKLLLPKLEEARRQRVRIVTYVFSVPGWSYDAVRDFKGTKVYLYSPTSESPNDTA